MAPIRVVLNVANLGHYGSLPGMIHFKWDQIAVACDFYEAHFGRLGVCGIVNPHTLKVNAMPVNFKYADRFVTAPVVYGCRDADDIFTIRTAQQHGCQFVDNDNYRDHASSGSRLDEPTIRFLTQARGSLHVRYMFDPDGNFVPDRDPLVPRVALDSRQI